MKMIPKRFEASKQESCLADSDGSIDVEILVRCPICRGQYFSLLLEYEANQPISSGGGTQPYDPAWATCSACSHNLLIYFARSDGYNGVISPLSGEPSLSKCVRWKGAREENYQIKLNLHYDSDVAGVDESGKVDANAFHLITICAVFSDGGVEEVVSFDAA